MTLPQSHEKPLNRQAARQLGGDAPSTVATATSRGTADMPDALRYARHDGNASTTTGFPSSSGLFTGHRRGHQYAVNRQESYGGASPTVDRDAWDAPVAVVG